MNIGIFGGTFDPVHNAHIRLAKFFIDKFNLDKCYLVPCNISPFKEAEHLHPSDNNDRMEMLKIAKHDDPKIEISDFELNQGGVSYTIETVRHFRALHPDSTLYLLIGRDQASEFVRWKNFQEIANLSTIVIGNRYKAACSMSIPETIERLGEYNIFPKLLGNEDMLESSTAIRYRIFKKLPIGNFLDKDVLNYIQTHKLYS